MSCLSVIIVNYRAGTILPACLDSLTENAPPTDLEILVVNNDQERGLASTFAGRWPATQFIQNPSNLGFAAAVNIGFCRSQGEFVLLVNPDIVAQPGSLRALVEIHQSHPNAGIVIPRLSNPDGSLQYSCRRFYTYATLGLRRAPFQWLCPNHQRIREHLMLDWGHDCLEEVDWGLGAAMMIRRSSLEGPKIFDERFFLYFEDVDLCLRMWQRGWKVLYNPAASMMHRHRRDSANY